DSNGLTKSGRSASTVTRDRMTCMGWCSAASVDCRLGKVIATSIRALRTSIGRVVVESIGTRKNAPVPTDRSRLSSS
ncbi:MAG: hypothetical protein WC239_11445, partial [Sphaerochaetaceae bacterium]